MYSGTLKTRLVDLSDKVSVLDFSFMSLIMLKILAKYLVWAR